jgi:DNA polymerase I-like protein with 3'-5' exonuclease and polymerase domains
MSGRQMGKKSNHGLNYDEGYNTFSLVNEVEIAEAKRIIALYHHIYPGIRRGHEGIRAKLAKDRTLINCFGRKIRFLDAWGDDLWKAAYSAIPQSTVGDNTNMGMRDCYNDEWLTSKQGVNLDLLANVHDSCLFQVPITALTDSRWGFDKVIERVYTHMEPELEYNGRRFKIGTDSKFGMNWGAFHPDHNSLGMKELTAVQDIKEYIVGREGT